MTKLFIHLRRFLCNAFSGTQHDHENRPYITGVVHSFSLKGTIDGALLINPAIKTVYAIDDDTIHLRRPTKNY